MFALAGPEKAATPYHLKKGSQKKNKSHEDLNCPTISGNNFKHAQEKAEMTEQSPSK